MASVLVVEKLGNLSNMQGGLLNDIGSRPKIQHEVPF